MNSSVENAIGSTMWEKEPWTTLKRFNLQPSAGTAGTSRLQEVQILRSYRLAIWAASLRRTFQSWTLN
jgi:hypothetical protein